MTTTRERDKFACPYCGERHDFDTVEPERGRHPQHTTQQCRECEGFQVLHQNGKRFPLTDRSNKEADAIIVPR